MALGGEATAVLELGGKGLGVNQIVRGRILRVDNEFVLVDVGYKSEGSIARSEWDEDDEEPAIGQEIDVLIEEVENDEGVTEITEGMLNLSKRKAKKIREWEKVMSSVHEGDVVTGVVGRKIKGGLYGLGVGLLTGITSCRCIVGLMKLIMVNTVVRWRWILRLGVVS